MPTVQSIIDRVTFITKDPDHVRWTLDELVLWINNAISMIADTHPRAASEYRNLRLVEGARQNLRSIDPAVRWVRLMELVCNCDGAAPNGPTIRQVSRPALDFSRRNWRSARLESQVKEYTMDEREPFTFDVYPPVEAGTTVHALVSITPPPVEDEDSDFPLADGYDIPTVDYVLFRAFSKDAGDQTYMARATGHLQAYQLAMGIETKDASA